MTGFSKMQVLSFSASGSFAAFKDPSVTTNYLVYFVPSKSAIVGMIGAMLGVARSNSLGDIYEEPYIRLYNKTRVGIRMNSMPKKVTFYTNHRTLLRGKNRERYAKPVKAELLENPSYTIFVESESSDRVYDAIREHDFVYTPYLGHAYCPATISDPVRHSATHVSGGSGNKTDCVVLDESGNEGGLTVAPESGSVIVEKHLHHSLTDGALHRSVLKYWIPCDNLCEIRHDSERTLSKFVRIEDRVVCMY